MRSHATQCEREREREDGWSALIDELMRIRWRNIGPPNLIPQRPYFGNICAQSQEHLFSLISLSLSERKPEIVWFRRKKKKKDYTKIGSS
jgi:hypothetical protein